MEKSLGKPLITCFTIIILLMAAIIAISVRGLNMVEKQTSQIINSVTPLKTASSNILISILNEETGINGYLASGNKDFLQPYYTGKKQILDTIKTINKDIDKYPEIKLHIETCIKSIKAIEDFFEKQVSLANSGKLQRAKASTETGRTLVNSFRHEHNHVDEAIDKHIKKELYSASIAKSDIVDILISVSCVVFLLTLAIVAMILQIINEDIKRGKQLNLNLERTIKDQEEFYANISHELKTPLNVILSTVQLLDMYNKNQTILDQDNMKRYLNIMKQNCFRLSKLSNNLIDMSKIDAGYIELNLKNVDIVSAIEDITLSVVDYGEVKGVTLIFDTDVEEKIMAFDPDKIERIMLNLLSNAFKFTNPGDQISVTIKDCKDYIKVYVRDTGIGIPEDKLDLIFERFKQVDKSLKRNTEGSGIGLSLVKSLVTMHGGKIYVNSEQSYFSEFVFQLPARIIEEENNITEKSLANNTERITIEFSDIYFNL